MLTETLQVPMSISISILDTKVDEAIAAVVVAIANVKKSESVLLPGKRIGIVDEWGIESRRLPSVKTSYSEITYP